MSLNRWKVFACTLTIGVGGLAVFAGNPPTPPKPDQVKEPAPLPDLTVKPATPANGADTPAPIKPVKADEFDLVVPAPPAKAEEGTKKPAAEPVFEPVVPSLVVPAGGEVKDPAKKDDKKKPDGDKCDCPPKAKADAPKADAPKVELDAPKADTPKPDAPKPDPIKPPVIDLDIPTVTPPSRPLPPAPPAPPAKPEPLPPVGPPGGVVPPLPGKPEPPPAPVKPLDPIPPLDRPAPPPPGGVVPPLPPVKPVDPLPGIPMETKPAPLPTAPEPVKPLSPVSPPEPVRPVTPAPGKPIDSAKGPPTAKLKMLLRMGDGQPRFEIRNSATAEVLLKVYADKVEMQAPPDAKSSLAGVTAIGRVRFSAPGIEGTCEHLTILSGTGEVLLKDRIHLKAKSGRAWSEMTAEKMVYQIGTAGLTAPGARPAVTPASYIPD